MSLSLTLATVALASLAAPAPAGAPGALPFAVHERTFDNGLRVIVVPQDSPGVVAFMSIVRTGSRDEVEPGKTGFAHFFEHMMFRGTPRYSTAAYNDVLKRMGADSNAYTTDDYTAYYIVGPASELPTIVDIEADRFQHLAYSEEDFRTEALAIRGEYAKSVSSPGLPLSEAIRQRAFTRHTYGHTTMGYLADIQAMPDQLAYSRSFFERFYRPDNTVLLVVGDARPDQVFDLAQRHYGDWRRGYQPPKVQPEPPPRGEQRGAVAWPTPTRPYLAIAHRTPAFDTTSRDTATLHVIAQLLLAESAPLYQRVVIEQQWADALSGGPADRRDPYLFTISARARDAAALADLERAVLAALDDLKRRPVDAARLERVKSHLRYDLLLSMDSPANIAFQLANVIGVAGDVQALGRLNLRISQVTPADVQRVAKQVFDPKGRTTVTLAHTAPAPAPTAPAPQGGAQ